MEKKIFDFHKKLISSGKRSGNESGCFFASLIEVLDKDLFNNWINTYIIEEQGLYEDLCYGAHKALRQTDVFQDASFDVLLWNYLQISNKLWNYLKVIIDFEEHKE